MQSMEIARPSGLRSAYYIQYEQDARAAGGVVVSTEEVEPVVEAYIEMGAGQGSGKRRPAMDTSKVVQ
jgi:hypothetical protein